MKKENIKKTKKNINDIWKMPIFLSIFSSNFNKGEINWNKILKITKKNKEMFKNRRFKNIFNEEREKVEVYYNQKSEFNRRKGHKVLANNFKLQELKLNIGKKTYFKLKKFHCSNFLNILEKKQFSKRRKKSYDIMNIKKHSKFSEINNYKKKFLLFLKKDKNYFERSSKFFANIEKFLKKSKMNFIYKRSFSNSKVKKKFLFGARFKNLYYNLLIKHLINKISENKNLENNNKFLFYHLDFKNLCKLDKKIKKIFKKKNEKHRKSENQFIKKLNKNSLNISKVKIKFRNKNLFSHLPKDLIKIKGKFPTISNVRFSNHIQKITPKIKNNLKNSKTTKVNYLIEKNKYIDDLIIQKKKINFKKHYSLRTIKKSKTPLKLYLDTNVKNNSKIFKNKKIISKSTNRFIIHQKLNLLISKTKIQ